MEYYELNYAALIKKNKYGKQIYIKKKEKTNTERK